ncbi:GWT1 domain-containing protein [Hirsutella rhossiliensis]|uniref:GPI-anchored wall transfer protein n=1 Tax=Hirsutella rhossiliensis TaxID=111463 RepID=A0A9P8N097_9HYPO|nr:GWT1 domain-containing protein [Hirsutella rhossiliensis]KAH0962382.1 GWT1 domain-containing protein [Hirsutella rhossiliensis]
MDEQSAGSNMFKATSYKQQKEDFVSNLSGGSVTEIGLVTSVAPVAVLLWSVLEERQSFFQPKTVLTLAVDYALNVGAILLATTLYSSTPLLLSILLVAPIALVYLLPPSAGPRRRKPRVPPAAASKGRPDGLSVLPVKPFLTTYRGCMMVVTCVAILAVDFRLFPRRFAKVETWGTSLMDMGVGSFVFAGGLFAARPVLAESMSGRATPLLRRLIYSARHSVPLLVLGIIRLLSVKGLDYAEHVAEYGVHWNFFFTLGFLPPFVATCQTALSIVPSYAALTLLIGGTYQLLLDQTELKAFILAAPRTDLLSMNREGIFSFFGYLAIFLAGQHLGMLIIPRSVNARTRAGVGTPRNTLLLTMAAWAGIWSGLYWLSTSYSFGLGLSVSRRLANLPYVLWVAAFNSLQILAFCCIDIVFFPAFYSAANQTAEREAYETATSRVLRAYNRNGLAIFLLANLLTGLVNMTVHTLDVSAATTMGILLAYMATVTGAALVLDACNISIKL